ncbi:MAG: DUF481 domain-containing protein [Planctomycetota bacterium]
MYGKLTAFRESSRRVWRVLAAAIFSDNASGTSRSEGRAELTSRWRSPESPCFLSGTGRYQYNRFQAWQDRLGTYAGLGNTLEVAEGFEFTTEAGIRASDEYGRGDAWTPEAVFAANGFAWSLSPRQSLSVNSRFSPDLRDAERYRIEAEADGSLTIDTKTKTYSLSTSVSRTSL